MRVLCRLTQAGTQGSTHPLGSSPISSRPPSSYPLKYVI